MSNFDLNLTNYKKSELEEIFNLPFSGKYTVTDIEKNSLKLKEKVKIDKTINNETRIKTIDFLNEVTLFLKEGKNVLNIVSSDIKKLLNFNHELQPSPIIEAGNTFTIEKPNTSFAMSYPSDFFPGTINPLKKRTLRQNLNIDTKFRDNYYTSLSSNFHFDLPIRFMKIVSMELTAFEFPTSHYSISKQAGNNFFAISFCGDIEMIIVQSGNYSSQGLVDYLNNYVSLSTNTNLNAVIFSLKPSSGNNDSAQLIIGLTSDIGMDIAVNFQCDIYGNVDTTVPLPLKLGWMMGFRNGIYTDDVTYFSEGIVDLSGSKYLYLVIDDYNNNVNNGFYSAFNSSILNQNILARISLVNNATNTLSFVTSPRQYFGPVDIQKVNVQLLDEYGRIVDLNNMDYSFCLSMTMIYDL